MRKLFFLILPILLLACQDTEEVEKIPKHIMTEEEILPILLDIHIAEALIEQQEIPKTDSLRYITKMYFDEIFEKHKVTSEKFHESFNYYLDRPEIMDLIYKQLLSEINKAELEQ